MRIGCGAGFLNDRIDAAKELIEKAELDYVVFECLAERTLGNILKNGAKNGEFYAPTLLSRMQEVLPICLEKDTIIITNEGAADPVTAGFRVANLANEMGFDDVSIGVVIGDRILDNKILKEITRKRDGEELMGAFAYLGAEPIVNALRKGVDVVITGRVADTSLFLGPMIYEFGWKLDDWDVLAKGATVGHLLECCGQITGGYFASPPEKVVTNLARLGFPYAEVSEEGEAIITKPEGTGGAVTALTCKEQLLYEIFDPENYITPDVVVDFTGVEIREIGKNKVLIEGARGKPRPENLKVIVFYKSGYIGEGEISYGGYRALERAKLASEIILERLKIRNISYEDVRVDFIGINSLSKAVNLDEFSNIPEVRLRIAIKTRKFEDAKMLCDEVEALLTNGPAGGGGVRTIVDELVRTDYAFIPREKITTNVITLKSR